MSKFNLVLGLEIHLHVKTPTKMFCGCSSDIYSNDPNTHTCPTCLGLPGALPVPNYDAIEKTQLLGLALGCTLNKNSKFDRKHYFYPDLPKGYQISQYKEPFCEGGSLKLDSGTTAYLERIHLEEDTAKSFHEHGNTLIDFNKSGMALIEIVTKPCFTKIEDAVDFSKKIQDLIICLGVGDGDMEKGQMRLEANISMRTQDMAELNILPNYKVEVKNINSFRFMEKAVKAEMVRQSELLEKGETVKQENRGYDEASGKTVPQRDKEEAHDYRYFPEPDIPPMTFDQAHIDQLQKRLPELPWERKEKILKLGVSSNNAAVLATQDFVELYKKFNDYVGAGLDPVKTSNLLLNKKETRDLSLVDFKKLLEAPTTGMSSQDLDGIVKGIITANPNVVEQIKGGKESALEFLVGQVMRQTKGQSNPQNVREAIKASL